MHTIEPFKDLFRRYRLRSEFETLQEFGNALSESNYVYETSIFSHWQKGSRVPKNRKLLLEIIKLFINRNGITSVHEANRFIASTGQGYLTDVETQMLPLKQNMRVPFQAPRLPDIIVGRSNIITEIIEDLKQYKTVLISGKSGIGKTTIAIKAAHDLIDYFPDGIIWCNGYTADTKKIIYTIVESFGEVLPPECTLEYATNLYRTLISKKRALFVIDNLSADAAVENIIPNSSQSSVLVTSVNPLSEEHILGKQIELLPFSKTESLELFSHFLQSQELEQYKDDLDTLAASVNNIPLSLVLIGKQLSNSTSIQSIINDLNKKNTPISLRSISIFYKQLSPIQKNILILGSLFKGAQFNINAIAFVLNMSLDNMRQIVNKLVSLSFIEPRGIEQFSLHSLIRSFINAKKYQNRYLKRLAIYYVELINQSVNNSDYFHVMSKEVDNIIGVIENCLDAGFLEEACELWQKFGSYYWHIGSWESFKKLSLRIYEVSVEHNKIELQLSICLEEVSRLYYYDGNLIDALAKAEKALQLAKKIESKFLIALAHQRYAKLCFMTGKVSVGFKHLITSGTFFKNYPKREYYSHNLRYESEGWMLKNDYNKAKDLLKEALSTLMDCENISTRNIYKAVIYSHLGIIEFLDGRIFNAKEYFLIGLSDDEKIPLLRGTYTWLNKFSLALTYHKLRFEEESKDLMQKAKLQMKQLGIISSYSKINVYSRLISEEAIKLSLEQLPNHRFSDSIQLSI